MPVTTHPAEAELYGDEAHWKHVMETLFFAAVEEAGYEPIAPVSQGSHLIHAQIIENLEKADLVLCDLSSVNPNVFFELGVRTSLDKPIALVRDEYVTDLPFDVSGINTHSYDSRLLAWEMTRQRAALVAHIKSAASSCAGRNPLWRQFGLTLKAQELEANETPLEAKVDLLMGQLSSIRSEARRDRELTESVLLDLERRRHVQTLADEQPLSARRRNSELSDEHFIPSWQRNSDQWASERFVLELTATDLGGTLMDFEFESTDRVRIRPERAVPFSVRRRVEERAKTYGVDVMWLDPTH